MEQTGNPAFKNKSISSLENTNNSEMSRLGTYLKTGLLLLICITSAAISWRSIVTGTFSPNLQWLPVMLISIATLVIGLIISFKPKTAPILSIPYAVVEGLLLGTISAIYANAYDGIVGQAIFATIIAFVTVYAGYSFGFLKATPRFKKILITVILSIAIIYFFSWILSFFNIYNTLAYGNSNISIGFSIVVVTVAALSLILDFDYIEKSSKQNMPKYFEWYGAFGLLVGLVWLYLEILRLLGKLAGKN